MKKNDEFELEITDIGNDGEGIGHYDGMTFFVKGTIPGDRILAGATKLKKNYGYARLISILQASPYRADAACPAASRCGGCQLQSMKYEKQLQYKEDKVRECLKRLGGIEESRMVRIVPEEEADTAETDSRVEFYPIIGMENPVHYRNKAQFPIRRDKTGKVISGFYAGHTHSVIDIESCMIQHEVSDYLLYAVREYMAAGNISAYSEEQHTGLVRHVLTRVGFTTGEVMVCVVINGEELPKQAELLDRLEAAVAKYNTAGGCRESGAYRLASVSYCINKERTNVIMGDRVVTIAGAPYIEDYIGDIRYRISPLSFYQVNPVQTNALYSTALEYADLTGGETVWDLYCGIGTISLFLAQKAKNVYGVEIVPQAIEDAKVNASINGITNAEFFCGASEEILPAKFAQNPELYADVIVVDPPRKGCDEQLLQVISEMNPKRVVYVSCDPATLARDIRFLEANGYRLKKVRPVDMFPWSGHVETVVLLNNRNANSDTYVQLTADMEDKKLAEKSGKLHESD